MSKNIFAVKQKGETKYLTVTRAKVNIPGFGVMTREEFLANEKALRESLSSPVLGKLFTEVSEEAYNAAIEEEAQLQAEKDQALAEQQEAEEKAAYEAAKEIVAAYESKQAEKSAQAEADKKAADAAAKQDDQKKADLDALRMKYKELTGKEPGNKKAETLQKEIDALNTPKS